MNNQTEPPAADFSAQLKDTIKDLTYLSETDAPFEIFDSENFRQIKFTEFFAPLTAIYEGSDETVRARAARFAKLKQMLESHLTNLTVFKFGKINKEIYIVGLDENEKMIGLKTLAVET